MKRILLSLLLVITGMISSAYALPQLQLNIVGGTYVDDFDGNPLTKSPFDESIIIDDPVFTLQAFLYNSPQDLDSQTMFLSSALRNLDGSSVASTSDSMMIDNIAVAWLPYGTPNLLPGHGVYPTTYAENAFNFASSGYYTPNGIFNVATGAETGNPGYIRNFTVDVSGLGGEEAVVFDLYTYYNKATGPNEKLTIAFAPPSHNAVSNPVPEPATMALLGLGVLGIFSLRKRS